MLPNLIIIGSRKSATTSLHYYLSLDPEIYMSTDKELNFFVKELGWKKGIRWYEKQFPISAKVRGESSPNYTRFPIFNGVPQRMHSVIPDAKLIYLVRDPIERFISACYHDLRGGIETRTFEEMLGSNLEESPHVYGSLYHLQLTQFLKYYPCSRILVVASGNLNKNPHGVMQQIFEFLGVDPTFRSNEFREMKNVSTKIVIKRKLCKLERFAVNCDGRRRWLGQIARSVVPVYLKLRKRKLLEPRMDLPRPIPSSPLKECLQKIFKADVQKLRKLTGQAFKE